MVPQSKTYSLGEFTGAGFWAIPGKAVSAVATHNHQPAWIVCLFISGDHCNADIASRGVGRIATPLDSGVSTD